MKKFIYHKKKTEKNTFYYLELGNKSGKTILFLHGYADTAEMFIKPGKMLQGRRIIALDFPMVRGKNIPETLDSLTEFVLDFVAGIGLSQFDLFGFSLGGLVAIKVAGKCSQVKKLYVANIVPSILINPFERSVYKILHPYLTSRYFCYLWSKLKTYHKTLSGMKNNYFSIYGTMFGIGNNDLTNIFNNLSLDKYLFVYKDDKVVNFYRYQNQLKSLKCNYYLFDKGGHCSKDEYWTSLVPALSGSL